MTVEPDTACLCKLAEFLGTTDADVLESSRTNETVADLVASGVDSQVVGQIRDLTASVSEQQVEILDLTYRLNTGNGEQSATLEGLRTNNDFRDEAINQWPVNSPIRVPTSSSARNQLVIVEYQGAALTTDGDDEIDIPPRRLPKRTACGLADDALEHLASNEHIARFFRENPELWQVLKEGCVLLEVSALYTPIPGVTHRVGTMPLAVAPEFVEGMDAAVSPLNNADTAVC